MKYLIPVHKKKKKEKKKENRWLAPWTKQFNPFYITENTVE